MGPQPRVEGNNATNLGLYELALGNESKAKYWSQFAAYDGKIPDPNTTGSVNIPIRYQICQQNWSEAAKFFDLYRTNGWQLNELCSPIYTESVYFSVALASVLAPDRYESFKSVFRSWTAFLAIQSAVVRLPAVFKFKMGTEEHVLKRASGNGLWRPPSGMRTNPSGVVGNGGVDLLAQILSFPSCIGGGPFDPNEVAHDIGEFGQNGSGLRMPRAHIHAVKDHLPALRTILGHLQKDCRAVVDGDYSRIDALRPYLEPIRLRTPLKSYVVQRGDQGAVLTAWSGRQTSIQKPYVCGASHESGRYQFCIPDNWPEAKNRVATPGTSTINGHSITATADTTVSMPMLSDPRIRFTFYPDKEFAIRS